MALNRAVCLCMPEAGVPWFHEKYCQSRSHSGKLKMLLFFNLFSGLFKHLLIIESSVTSPYHVDIYECLKQVLGNDKFIATQTHSPYYHTIGIYCSFTNLFL